MDVSRWGGGPLFAETDYFAKMEGMGGQCTMPEFGITSWIPASSCWAALLLTLVIHITLWPPPSKKKTKNQENKKQNKNKNHSSIFHKPLRGNFPQCKLAFVCAGLKKMELKVTAVVINTEGAATLTMPRAHRRSINTHFVSNSEFPHSSFTMMNSSHAGILWISAGVCQGGGALDRQTWASAAFPLDAR